jgi:YihY family inner membrane protein
VDGERRSRSEELTQRLEELRERAEALPGAPLALEVARNERELGGGLLAGGVAFRAFLWLVPFGVVTASLASFWSEYDEDGLEAAAREFGIGAAAAQAAAEALQTGEQNAAAFLGVGLVLLAWFTLGAVRALVLAYALAWRLERPRIRRPLHVIVLFNGLFVLAIAASAGTAWLREQIGVTALLGSVITVALTAAVALMAMWLLPHRATELRELLPGAALVAVGHALVNVAVVFYFAPKLGDSEETYGAFGAAATMLVWLYVLARLITGAAFLNATLWAHRQAEAQSS